MSRTRSNRKTEAVETAGASSARRGPIYFLIFGWGVLGVAALLTRAIVRLAPLAWEPIDKGLLSPGLWLAFALWILFNGYGEGYRAFQKSFCPRVVARADYLARWPHAAWRAAIAPAFCLSLVFANRRGKTVAWVMVAVVALLVAALRRTPQPYRGIIDGGVVVALIWGVASLLVFAFRTVASGQAPPARLNLPDEEGHAPERAPG